MYADEMGGDPIEPLVRVADAVGMPVVQITRPLPAGTSGEQASALVMDALRTHLPHLVMTENEVTGNV